ncbi:MAG: CRISPR-associated protein Cas4 [Planctomycetes bacterium]|nr:CRISPR-associated protein Cas4 [Planctomycetota bacterium]
MFSEDDLLPLSGVQHTVFCVRQAALIHVEQAWTDNAFTIDGRHRHAGVHEEALRRERRGDLVIVRGLALRSLELGLSGVADVVEFHRVDSGGVKIPGARGLWEPYPVEYKRGRRKRHRADEVQVCAQGMCLEEMLGVPVGEGALFYGMEQRRMTVALDAALRDLTVEAARRFRELVEHGETPAARKEKKCETCSLVELCMPEAMTRRRSARRYVTAALERSLQEGEDPS